MKKLSIVMAAVMCMAFGINAFAAGPQPFKGPQQPQKKVQVVQPKQVAKIPVQYVQQRPQPQVVVVQQAPRYPQPRYVYVQPRPRVVVVNDAYQNNNAAIVAAGLLGIGLIAAAIAN